MQIAIRVGNKALRHKAYQTLTSVVQFTDFVHAPWNDDSINLVEILGKK
jgi:hypothetical protein